MPLLVLMLLKLLVVVGGVAAAVVVVAAAAGVVVVDGKVVVDVAVVVGVDDDVLAFGVSVLPPLFSCGESKPPRQPAASRCVVLKDERTRPR